MKTNNIELSEIDKAKAWNLWFILEQCTQKGHFITNKQLQKELIKTDVHLHEPEIRKLIHWLHVNGHLPGLIASRKGYSFSFDIDKLKAYKNTLEQRAALIQERVLSVDRDITELINKI